MSITRRTFVLGAGAAAGLLGARPLVALPRVRRRALVVVFLRGGVDGLNLVVPHGDERYSELRRSIGVPRPGAADGALDLDGFFGLHPAAAPLAPLFRSGTAVALHAVGSPHNTRSHFEEQDVWETCLVAPPLGAPGWLNRYLATTPGPGPVRAVAVGDTLPRILRGESLALALRGLSEFAGEGGPERLAVYDAALRRAYGDPDRDDLDEEHRGAGAARALLARSGGAALQAMRELAVATERVAPSEVHYPQGELGRRLAELARILKAGVGLEVAAVDYGGWDTHQAQGGARGPFANKVGELAGGLAAFCEDLGGALDEVLVLAFSEFGRTAAQNGTGGTDHGWGNCLLALGGPVRAAGEGRPRNVLGAWPGLAPDALQQGRDLAHTTDFRDVFAEVARRHLACPQPELVVPDHAPQPVGLI